MTLIAAPPPGPVAGQPGHFAHTNWVEASLKLLSLPLPVTTYLATGVPISAAAATALGCDAVVVNPDPTKLLICQVFGQSQMSVGSGLTAAINSLTTGATVIAAGTRGEEGRSQGGVGTMTLNFQRQIVLNPGTTTVRLTGAVVAGSGSQTFSFNKITVLPVGWQ